MPWNGKNMHVNCLPDNSLSLSYTTILMVSQDTKSREWSVSFPSGSLPGRGGVFPATLLGRDAGWFGVTGQGRRLGFDQHCCMDDRMCFRLACCVRWEVKLGPFACCAYVLLLFSFGPQRGNNSKEDESCSTERDEAMDRDGADLVRAVFVSCCERKTRRIGGKVDAICWITREEVTRA